MNENLNLVEILKDCPKGTKLYSTAFGDVYFYQISNNEEYPIGIDVAGNSDYRTLTCDGKLWRDYGGECILFPSREERDWSKFKPKNERFDPKKLKAFDKVIAKLDSDDIYYWFADFVSMPANGHNIVPCIMSNKEAKMIIPYNEETKHLVGTTEKAPDFYRYWED